MIHVNASFIVLKSSLQIFITMTNKSLDLTIANIIRSHIKWKVIRQQQQISPDNIEAYYKVDAIEWLKTSSLTYCCFNRIENPTFRPAMNPSREVESPHILPAS